MSKWVTAVINQNILDICLQEYGSLDFLFILHLDNNLTEFPARITAGQRIIVYPNRVTGSKRPIAILQQRKPGTGDYRETESADALFWDSFLHPDNYLYPDSHLLTEGASAASMFSDGTLRPDDRLLPESQLIP